MFKSNQGSTINPHSYIWHRKTGSNFPLCQTLSSPMEGLHIIIQHFTNIRIARQSTWLIECAHQQMLKAKIKGHPWEKEMCSEKVDWPQETVTRIRATTALHVLDNFWLLSPFRLTAEKLGHLGRNFLALCFSVSFDPAPLTLRNNLKVSMLKLTKNFLTGFPAKALS